MASMATTSSSQQVSPSSSRDPSKSRTPLPLSASQEQQVRDIYYKRVRTTCANEIREFATCALNRTFTATLFCRQQQHAMNTCMVKHATLEEQDRAREEWFATRDKRRAEREAKEQRRIEQEKFHREWWGLDDQGRRVDKFGGLLEPTKEGEDGGKKKS